MSELNKSEKLGPFAAVGVVLGTVGTMATAFENTVRTSGAVVNNTLQGVNMLMEDGLTALRITTRSFVKDIETDDIVEDAYRELRLAQALAKAAEIRATIPTSVNAA